MGGFNSMDPKRQRELAIKGGRNVPADKRSFSSIKGLASAAGHKGGSSVPGDKRSFTINRALAAEAGRRGGLMSQKRRREKEK